MPNSLLLLFYLCNYSSSASVINMLTKQPDYTISELGYPLLNSPDDKLHRKWRESTPNAPSACASSIPGSSSSSHRLLPLRETLDDYYKRLLQTELEKRESTDVVAQQKIHKNQWNLQQKQKQRDTNNHRR